MKYRIKDVVTLVNEKSSDNSKPYIGLENIESWTSRFLPSDSITEGTNNSFQKGDILFGKLRPYLAKGFIPDYDGICSTEFFVLRPKKITLPKYLLYFILSHSTIDYLRHQVSGVKMPRTNWSSFSNISIEIPSIEDQRKKVAYLDNKTSEIDSQISILGKKQVAFKKLKASIIQSAVTKGLNKDVELKDSEIDWIGRIPKEWRRLRLKDIAYLYGGLSGKSGDDFRCEDDTITKPYIPFTNVSNNYYIDFDQFDRVVILDGETQNQVKENDLIFLMSSEDYESIAKSAVVIGDPGEVYLNSFCRGLRFTSKDVYAPFVNYQLNSEKYRDALRFEARGFTRINIKIDRIASQFITLPPYDEQVEIATYLDNKCSEIDSNIKNINDQIDALKALKKALINEVITGKRAV